MKNRGASKVRFVSRCRETSFYLAPGYLVYFKDGTLVALLPDGSWQEIKHRRDVAKIQRTHSQWGGEVLYAKGIYGLERVRENLIERPAAIERWQTDARVIEGRRPVGEQFVLHKLCWMGMHKAGGSRQVIEQALPGASRPLRAAATDLLERNRETAALRISLAAALREWVTDDEIAEALERQTVYELQLWAPVDINRYRTNFKRATEGMPKNRVRSMAKAVLYGTSLTETEITAAIEEHTRRSLSEGETAVLSPDIIDDVLQRDDESFAALTRVADLSSEQQRTLLERIASIEVQAEVEENDGYWGYDRRKVLIEDACRSGCFTHDLTKWALESGVDVVPYGGVFPHNRETYEMLMTRLTNEREREAINTEIASGPRNEYGAIEALIERGASVRVKAEIAARRDLPENTQAMLYREARDGLSRGETDYRLVLSRLASNTSVSDEIIISMLSQPNYSIHQDITRTRILWEAASKEVLDAALTSDVPHTRAAGLRYATDEQQSAMARSEESPVVLVQLAAVARDREALKTIAERTKTYTAKLENPDPGVKVAGVVDIVTGLRILDAEAVAEALMTNEIFRNDAELCDHAYRTGSDELRCYLVETSESRLSEDIRLEAASDENFLIRSAALKTVMPYGKIQQHIIKNPGEREELLRWMLVNAELLPETQEQICQTGSIAHLCAMTSNKHALTRETLEDLATHRSPNVRRSVAGREKDRDITEALLTDSDRTTREHAEALLRFNDELQTAKGRQAPRPKALRRMESRKENDIHRVVSSAATRLNDPGATREHHPIEYAAHPAAVLAEMRDAGGPLIVTTKTEDVRHLPNFSSLRYKGLEERKRAVSGLSYDIEEGYLQRKVPFSIDYGNLEEIQAEIDELKPGEEQITTLTPRVIDSPQMLKDNKTAMANCTESYGGRIARGTTLIVALDDQRGVCRMNIHLEHSAERNCWEVEQINTLRNGYGVGNTVPTAARVIAENIRDRINQQDASESESIKENLEDKS